MKNTEIKDHIRNAYKTRISYGNKCLITVSILSIIWSLGLYWITEGISNPETNLYNQGFTLLVIGLIFFFFILLPYRAYIDVKIGKILNKCDFDKNFNIENVELTKDEKEFFKSYRK